jgi:hypothetical protein
MHGEGWSGVWNAARVKMGAVCGMKRKTKRRDVKRRGGAVILALAAALFVVLLVIRMLVFVVGRHRY